jgi:hypothetical protein
MKKLILTLAAVVMATGLFASGAHAFISGLTLDAKASLDATKTSVVATGTVVCSSGDDVDVSVVIVQSSGKVNAAGTGFGTFTCTGTLQTYSVVVNLIVGTQFKNGPATALFGAFDSSGDSTMTFTQGVHLQK